LTSTSPVGGRRSRSHRYCWSSRILGISLATTL
jgi:hypothetical protein